MRRIVGMAPKGGFARVIIAVALVLCSLLQPSDAFSQFSQQGLPMNTGLLTRSRARTSLSNRPYARLLSVRAKRTIPGLLRTDSTISNPQTDVYCSPFVSRVAEPCRRGASMKTQTAGWVGTGIYLYTTWQVSAMLNSVLAGLLFLTGKYKKMLTTAGLFHAWILGVILWGSLGPGGWTTGAFYLAAGSRVTKIKMAEKEAKGIAEGRGGARGPENVWGSAASAAICALMAALSPWDSGIFKLGFVASLATKLSDTFASEIGKAYGKTTYLITSLERVEPGTEGAVSLEGTLAGVGGSLLLAVWGLLAKQIFLEGVLFCLVAAFVATTAESYIGATLQGKISWMTNEVVNFINTAIGAVVGMALYALFI